jgi:hypothetical protein
MLWPLTLSSLPRRKVSQSANLHFTTWKGSLPMKIPRTLWEYQTLKTQFGRANDIYLGCDLIIGKTSTKKLTHLLQCPK